ncbi:MAG: putative dimethyl sulfoxide reductase chaperone [Mycobacterium sp.]|jgi:hypothetical protein|nr:putative dimethyl sulfoxide reductase chaperone [Mycobacterium sp.]
MDREQLFASIVAACPDRDDVVYLERRGGSYAWRLIDNGDLNADIPAGSGPEVWMSFSAAWPVDDAARMRTFFDDLLAELESMADQSDRCRWPLDEPWPHGH